MSKTASRKTQAKCPCGKPLVSLHERSLELCRECLDTGIPTARSKVPIPKGSCLSNPENMSRNALDRLLWLIDWWNCTVLQGIPEEAYYVACRLEELAAKIRRTV